MSDPYVSEILADGLHWIIRLIATVHTKAFTGYIHRTVLSFFQLSCFRRISKVKASMLTPLKQTHTDSLHCDQASVILSDLAFTCVA